MYVADILDDQRPNSSNQSEFNDGMQAAFEIRKHDQTALTKTLLREGFAAP